VSYTNLDDVKSLLNIKVADYDLQIEKCIQDADVWVDNNFINFSPDISLKRTIARLYAAYLFRTSTFENYTEEGSSLANELKREAENLVRIYKRAHSMHMKKVKALRIR